MKCDIDYGKAESTPLIPFIDKLKQEVSMNRLFLAAETALAFVTAAASSTAEANGFLLRQYSKRRHLRRTFGLETDAASNADPRPVDEKIGEPKRNQSTLCDLFASHPHVIAASLFTKKRGQ
jgi:hypothetical protein